MAHKKTTDPPLIKRNRDGDTHIEACGTGYLPGRPRADWFTYSNIHHIVCVTCMADGTIEDQVKNDDQFEFIKNCLAETDWNINDEPNTVGLPKKRTYVDKGASTGWDNWACHQIDHDLYIEAVCKRLKSQVWSTCQDVSQSCKLKGKELVTQLTKESGYWRGKLGSRGTVAAWAAKKNNPLWYKPFSMVVLGARPRKPPPDWSDKFTSGMVGRLGELFAMI